MFWTSMGSCLIRNGRTTDRDGITDLGDGQSGLDL